METNGDREITFDADKSKVFNDPVLGHIELPEPLLLFIDTPQFQRLRDIRQMGGTYHVFPGAGHHRFEHSLGVAYLAGKLLRRLRSQQPELKISDVDVLCVQIAGLLHDIGHGPFSHVFDGKFLPAARPGSPCNHEETSVHMFTHVLKQNGLKQQLRKYGINDEDLTFIIELFAGPRGEGGEYIGRGKKKRFLYEVVSNKRNGIDVDKWDYFARDCHHLGIRNNFDHNRCIKFVRVIEDEGVLQLCFREKEVDTLYDMFSMRMKMYRHACLHPVTASVENMLTDALLIANDYILTPGRNGKKRTIADCVDDMEAYTKLTDRVYYQILWSTEPRLASARRILQRVERRDLYHLVGQTRKQDDSAIDKGNLRQWEKEIAKRAGISSPRLLGLEVLKLDYGMSDTNPMDSVRFYSKNSSKAFAISRSQVSPLLPTRFQEMHLRLYYKGEHCDLRDINGNTKTAEENSFVFQLSRIRSVFNQWCTEHGFNPFLTTPALEESTAPPAKRQRCRSSSEMEFSE